MSKTKTTTVKTVRAELQKVGDKANKLYNETDDLTAAKIAIKAYNGSINAGRAQLIYKQMTGKPGTIAFFED
jgi:hypothetical protein